MVGTYFENRPKAGAADDAWNQYHRVARMENGRVREVCGLRFKSHVDAL
jgi:hypothetical protein